jgi:molecular chaperone DnaK
MESDNPEQIKSAVEALSRASHKLTETLYQQAGAQQQASAQEQPPPGQDAGPAAAGGGDEEVIDAEVVDEDKKS